MRGLPLAPCPVWSALEGTVLRVKNIFVAGLFGRFDHVIPMNLDDRITIIHGPNGFGKSVLLGMVSAFFGDRDSSLLSVPYSEFRIDFDNDESVSVFKAPNEKEPTKPNLRFVFQNPSGKQEFVLWTRPDLEPRALNMIEDVVEELVRDDERTWRNVITGETLSLDDVVERYGDQLPWPRNTVAPDWLKTARRSVPVRLIQAERLQAGGTPGILRHRVRHVKRSPSRAVMLYSEELGTIIQHALTEYASLSQSLDRTFPARVVSQQESPYSIAKLPEALAAIEAKRARLVEAGLLEKEAQEPPFLIPYRIDETKLPVLSVYVQDAEKKLGVFDQLVAKTEFFKKSINDRFLYKRVSIGKEGFRFVTLEGSPLNPMNLSSGEQHEVVLLYELLFRAIENSLILLDEPEISLHIAWQEQFLSDLGAITEISRLDALVATHSPQIISDRWDLTVELKGPTSEVLSDATQHS